MKIRLGMIFVYSHQNHIVFLYSDGKKEAVKYNIKTDSHRKIAKSKSLYQFLEHSDWSGRDDCYHIGLRVGNYFWIIFGGYCLGQDDNSWDESTMRIDSTTLLWSIKKEKWQRGPDLPTDLNLNHQMCSISVGINTAFILNREHTFSFNFKSNTGKFHKSPKSLLVQDYDLESCALHLGKDYHRYNS